MTPKGKEKGKMIRYVLIGDQINEGSNDFAFFDTAIDKFLSFNGCQIFESKEDFDSCKIS